MDRVRLGRALGYGTRHAAKTLTSAVGAVVAPNPNPTRKSDAPPASAHPAGQVAEAVRHVSHAKSEAKKAVKRSLLGPLKQFSSVVTLQVTGTFFALFTMIMGEAVWLHRHDFTGAAGMHASMKVYASLLLGLVFAYYTVSNFVKAARREKQKQ